MRLKILLGILLSTVLFLLLAAIWEFLVPISEEAAIRQATVMFDNFVKEEGLPDGFFTGREETTCGNAWYAYQWTAKNHPETDVLITFPRTGAHLSFSDPKGLMRDCFGKKFQKEQKAPQSTIEK